MTDIIADIYMNMRSQARVILETQEPDIKVPEEQQFDVINIYIKPSDGPIQRPYTGDVINTSYVDGVATVVAKDITNGKTIQVIMVTDNQITVTVMDLQGRVQDTFMGQNLDFYDVDSDGIELNIIKIEEI